MIRLYGHLQGSFRTVSAGMERAIRHHGKLSGHVPGENIAFDEDYPGGDAPVALTTGAAYRVLKPHVKGTHKHHWFMLAPNSEGIDPKLVEQLRGETYSSFVGGNRPVLDGLLTPSSWGKKILKELFPDHPIIVWRHGVLPEFKVKEEERYKVEKSYVEGDFNLLHVTSTDSTRKSTREVLRAWKRLLEASPNADRMRLDLLVNPTKLVDFGNMVKEEEVSRVMVIPGQNFSSKQYASGLSRYHGLVQPSRAEGFGLVPLEARACGIPVVVTDCTGHRDHCVGPGVLTVPHGGKVESKEYLGATMPDIKEDDVFDQLRILQNGWPSLDAAARNFAPVIQEEWSWENRATQPLSELEKITNG